MLLKRLPLMRGINTMGTEYRRVSGEYVSLHRRAYADVLSRHAPLLADQGDGPTLQRALLVPEVEERLAADGGLDTVAGHLQAQHVRAAQLPAEIRFGQCGIAIQRFDEPRLAVRAQQQGVVALHPLDAGRDPTRPNQVRRDLRAHPVVNPLAA